MQPCRRCRQRRSAEPIPRQPDPRVTVAPKQAETRPPTSEGRGLSLVYQVLVTLVWYLYDGAIVLESTRKQNVAASFQL